MFTVHDFYYRIERKVKARPKTISFKKQCIITCDFEVHVL